ncbi:hpo-12 [Pristionchus pacificus]|nr:hpo-12 [Pristionchus pacificus]
MVGYNPEPISGKELSTSDQSEAGLASGIATRAIIQPLDVLKIRFQLQEEPIGGKRSGKYRGVIQSVRLITREEGVRAFWKGHIPAQGLSAVYGLVQFAAFEWFSKQITVNVGGLGKAGTDFIAGGIAGSLAMTAAMPLDVIRTRLVAQAQAAGGDADGTRPVAYRGTLHAMVKIARREGTIGFFRGWLPSVAQVAPYTGLQFWFYNAICTRLDDLTGQHDAKLNQFVSGASAGTLAKTVLYPLDMVRHRLQMNGFQRCSKFGSTSDYSRGMVRSVLHIVKMEGMLGLFKGLWPSQIKAAANSGFAFLFYEMLLIAPLLLLGTAAWLLSATSIKMVLLAVIVASAALQGAAWPVCVAYLQRWLDGGPMGVLFSLLGSTTTVGGLALAFLAGDEWRGVAERIGYSSFILALFSWFVLDDREERSGDGRKKEGQDLVSSLKSIIGSGAVWRLSILYGLAMMTRSIAETWLPMFTHDAATVQFYFEIGGLIGSLASGAAVDAAASVAAMGAEPAARHLLCTTTSAMLIVTSWLVLALADTETPAHFLSLASLSLTSGAAVYASINIACLACATMAPGGRSSGTTTALVSFLAQIGSIVAGSPVAWLLQTAGRAALAPALSIGVVAVAGECRVGQQALSNGGMGE